MSEINRAVKGTNDVLPEDSYKWQYVEKTLLDTALLYGFKEIRLPVFEHTEVFSRSVGDTTDVVQKEMYTFDDKGGRSITLRPEITAGVVRSSIEHGLIAGTLPVKACYISSCYRYEKPQAGRLREFHQFGVECLGSASPNADAEIIALAKDALDRLGIKDLSLEINSIGCPECRKAYYKALKDYFSSNKDKLCDTCKDRLNRNPMRILDCKAEICKEVSKDAPVVIDFLCDNCKEHFENVKKYLDAMNIDYKVNPTIVRGLDYYTRTVFEFVSGKIGAQSTVCGGGRYDGLIKQMGGADTPALGFGMGIERLMLVAENSGVKFPEDKMCQLYIAPLGDNALLTATKLIYMLREKNVLAQTDINGRGLKSQMRYANKINAKFTLVLGDDEISNDTAKLKEMSTGNEFEIKLSSLADELQRRI